MRSLRNEERNRGRCGGLFARRHICAGKGTRSGRHIEESEGEQHLHDLSSRQLYPIVISRRQVAARRLLDRAVQACRNAITPAIASNEAVAASLSSQPGRNLGLCWVTSATKSARRSHGVASPES